MNSKDCETDISNKRHIFSYILQHFLKWPNILRNYNAASSRLTQKPFCLRDLTPLVIKKKEGVQELILRVHLSRQANYRCWPEQTTCTNVNRPCKCCKTFVFSYRLCRKKCTFILSKIKKVFKSHILTYLYQVGGEGGDQCWFFSSEYPKCVS